MRKTRPTPRSPASSPSSGSGGDERSGEESCPPPRRPRARTSAGQHYLINRGVLERIVAAAAPEAGDTVLEIGAGPGNLTRLLAETGARTVALELDRRFEPNLRHLEQQFPNLISAWGDVLEVDWEPLWGDAAPERRVIVGNLPFQITSPLLAKMSETRDRFGRAILMVQREVADRLTAPSGSRVRSALGVKMALDFEIQRLFVIRPNSFRPAPKVASAIVDLRPLAQPPVADETMRALTRRVVEAAFGSRRQHLVNSLANHWRPRVRREVWRAHLERVGLEPSQRAETVELEQFTALAEILQDSLRGRKIS